MGSSVLLSVRRGSFFSFVDVKGSCVVDTKHLPGAVHFVRAVYVWKEDLFSPAKISKTVRLSSANCASWHFLHVSSAPALRWKI